MWHNSFYPKQSHRWILKIDNFPEILALSVERPSFKFENITYKQDGSLQRNMNGLKYWNPIKIVFYDALLAKTPDQPASEKTSQSITPLTYKLNYEILKNGDKEIFTTQGFFSKNLLSKIKYNGKTSRGVDKQSLINVLGGSISINQLSDQGDELEIWEIINPLITKVEFPGDLNYSKSDASLVSITIAYDDAKLTFNSAQIAKIVEASIEQEEEDPEIKELIQTKITLREQNLAGSEAAVLRLDKAAFKKYLEDNIQTLEEKIRSLKDKYGTDSDKGTLQELIDKYNKEIRNLNTVEEGNIAAEPNFREVFSFKPERQVERIKLKELERTLKNLKDILEKAN